MLVKNLNDSHKSFWYLPTQIGRQIFEKNYKKTHNLQKGWTGLMKYKNFGEGEGIRMSVYTTKIFLLVLIRNNKITIPSQHFL